MISRGSYVTSLLSLLFTLPSLANLAGADDFAPRGELRGPQVYRVGKDCEYATIQQAIDAIPDNGAGVLRLRDGIYVENLLVWHKDVKIIGGHADCVETSPESDSSIAGSGQELPAIRFANVGGDPGTSYTLRLENLRIFGGTGNITLPLSTYPGGGISVLTFGNLTANVELHHTWVFSNQSPHAGGGIAMVGSGNGTLSLENNSILWRNTVAGFDPRGGGLACAGTGDYRILIRGGAISENTAGVEGEVNGRGGGIYLEGGCQLEWFAEAPAAPGDSGKLAHNTVYGRGGGLYATAGAWAVLAGAHGPFDAPSTRPLRIYDNAALGETGDGGAIYANLEGTVVIVDRGWTYDNRAQRRGGAAYAAAGAEVDFIRGNEPCHSPRRCSRVFDNRADVAAAGYVEGSGSRLRFVRTRLENNSTTGLGPILFSGNQGLVRLESSLLYGGGVTGDTFLIQFGGRLQVLWSTVADTRPAGHVFRLSGNNTELILRSSIVHVPGRSMVRVEAGTPSLVSSRFIIWHDDELEEWGHVEDNLVADPLFLDREKSLYYLLPGSPAINYAPASQGMDIRDLDWNPRGVCHTTGECSSDNIVDLGAYEMALDVFKDRFEAP